MERLAKVAKGAKVDTVDTTSRVVGSGSMISMVFHGTNGHSL